MSTSTIEISGEGVIDPTGAGLRLSEERLRGMASELETSAPIACPACTGTRFRRATRHDRYGFPLDYVACQGCGLLFANPYYDQPSLDRFYSRHYAGIYGRTARPDRAFKGELARGHGVWKLLGRHLATERSAFDSVLDIGCSHGGFLAAFPREWRRVGYDYDESLFEVGRAHGLELNSITRLDAEPRRFDVIMANQVVEHTADPVAFLRKLATLLSERGVIYIEVPGLRAPLVAGIDYRLMFKNAHRYLFEARTFERCAARAGLQAVYLDESVQALLRPGNTSPRPPVATSDAAQETLEFVRAKVAAWRPPGLMSRTLGWIRRIAGGVLRRLSGRD